MQLAEEAEALAAAGEHRGAAPGVQERPLLGATDSTDQSTAKRVEQRAEQRLGGEEVGLGVGCAAPGVRRQRAR